MMKMLFAGSVLGASLGFLASQAYACGDSEACCASDSFCIGATCGALPSTCQCCRKPLSNPSVFRCCEDMCSSCFNTGTGG